MSQQRRKPGERVDPMIIGEIKDMVVRKGWRPARVERELLKLHEADPEEVPHVKTIQKIWRQWTTDDSEAWRFADEDMTPEDARLVLRVLRPLNSAADHDEKHWPSEPLVRTVTKVEAKWIVRISRTAPTIPANWCYALARAYIAAEPAGVSTQPLDRVLASQPWDVASTDAQEYSWALRFGGPPPNESWEAIRYAADLLPFLPETWRPETADYKREAEEAALTAVAHDEARDAGFTDKAAEKGEDDDTTR